MRTLWCKNQDNPSDRISHAWAPLSQPRSSGAVRRSGRGTGSGEGAATGGGGVYLVPHSRRFTLSMTRGCLAAIVPREGEGRRWEGGGGAGGGGGEV